MLWSALWKGRKRKGRERRRKRKKRRRREINIMISNELFIMHPASGYMTRLMWNGCGRESTWEVQECYENFTNSYIKF